MEEKMLSIGEASNLLGVHINTLRDWDIEEKFKASYTEGGHRRYTIEQIREYLQNNKKIEKTNEIIHELSCDKIYKKWNKRKYLDENLSKEEKYVLSVLLENCESAYLSESVISNLNALFSTDQALWLTKQAWLRCRLKKVVSVQSLASPCGFIHFRKEKNNRIIISSEAVGAKSLKLGFSLFPKAEFSQVNEIYADAFAYGLDFHIYNNMPNKLNLEDAQDQPLNEAYDYIIAPKSFKKISERYNIDFYEMPLLLDPKTFIPMGVAGKYPKHKTELPIFCPYMIIQEVPQTINGFSSAVTRVGWLS